MLPEDVLTLGWEECAEKAKGVYSRIVVVRPALLTHGECKADAGGGDAYRIGEGQISSAYSISRRDTAHFICEKALKNWDKWEGKCLCIAS